MVVSGHLETIKRNMPESARTRRAVDAIEQASKRGVSLTKQLLAFSRRQSLTPQDIDLAQQIPELKTLVEASVGPKIALHVEIPDSLWPVRVDPNELELALLNIVMNAKDAMPSGGRVTISCRNAPVAKVDIGADLTGDFVELAVADTGCGMPPDIASKAFEPFFTTKPMGKGTGMGLSQVHGFAYQSGGAVHLVSKLGEGTKVMMYLPRGNALASNSGLQEEQRSSTGTGTVLVVEDNPEVASATASLVEALGYEVLIAANAEAALQIAAQSPPRLVVSDIVMAGAQDGLDLARDLRQSNSDLPILLVTGYTERLSEAEAEFPVLRKPFRATDLDRAISRAIAETVRPGSQNVVRLLGRNV